MDMGSVEDQPKHRSRKLQNAGVVVQPRIFLISETSVGVGFNPTTIIKYAKIARNGYMMLIFLNYFQ